MQIKHTALYCGLSEDNNQLSTRPAYAGLSTINKLVDC